MEFDTMRKKNEILCVLLIMPFILLLSMGGASAQVTQVVGGNINISKLETTQGEPVIAIDPMNPNNLFAFSVTEVIPRGLFASFSMDGGATWHYSDPSDGTIADGGDPPLPQARVDPSAAWDNFGNLFISYLGGDKKVHIAVSVDGGRNFTFLTSLGRDVGPGDLDPGADFPTIDAGAGSVWVTYKDGAAVGTTPIMASGAAVTGLGPTNIGAFSTPQAVPESADGNFGGVSIAPGGQVLVSYQSTSKSDPEGPKTIFVSLDADGLGAGGFGAAMNVTATNVGNFDLIPAQPERSISANAFLAYDRSGGANNGRVYLVYADETPDESNDTDVFIRFSDDDGMTWSAPVQVNDDSTTNSQFMARIAVDQTTGVLAVAWYDCRNDDGLGGAVDYDGVANNDVQFFATVSVDGGLTFEPNIQVSAGTSDEDGAEPHPPGFSEFDFGDYAGLAFSGGTYYPAWADNSNSTLDNPAGTLMKFDIYVAAVQVQGANTPPLCDADGPYTAECQGATTVITLDGTGSSDPDPGDLLTYNWSTSCPGGSFDDSSSLTPMLTGDSSSGSIVSCNASLTVTDSGGASDSCSSRVTIQDTTAPSLSPPADVTVECSSPDGTLVNLGTPTVSDTCDDSPVVTNDAPPLFPLGTTTVTWTVTDASGKVASATQDVTVVDTIPPELSISVAPNVLWPPNHKLVNITASVEASDICDANPSTRLLSIFSNEPDNGLGDGNTVNDIQGADIGNDDREFMLRAERSGNGNGRVYTITFEARDDSGKSTVENAMVTVPKSRRR